MKNLRPRRFPNVLPALMLAGALAACDRSETAVDPVALGSFDTALSRSQAAAREAEQDAAVATEQAEVARSALARAGREQASSAAQDAAISAAIQDSLRRDPTLQQHPINVHTVRRVVWLRGVVPTESVKAHAGAVARAGDGAQGVHNQLVVKPAQR